MKSFYYRFAESESDIHEAFHDDGGVDIRDWRPGTLQCAIGTITEILRHHHNNDHDSYNVASLATLLLSIDEWEHCLDDDCELITDLFDVFGDRLECLTVRDTYDTVRPQAALLFSILVDRCVVKCPNLVHLCIDGHDLDDESIGPVVGRLLWGNSCPPGGGLQRLVLTGCRMSTGAFFGQLREQQQQKDTNDQLRPLEDVEVHFYLDDSSHNSSLERALEELLELCRVCPRLKRLCLHNPNPDHLQQAGRGQLQMLTELFPFVPQLESLDISCMSLLQEASAKSLHDFFQALAALPSIQNVDLSQAFLTSQIIPPMIQFLESSETLQTLNLDYNRDMFWEQQSAENDTRASASSILIQQFARAIAYAPTLRELRLPMIQETTFLATLFQCLSQNSKQSSLEFLAMDETHLEHDVFLPIDKSWVRHVPCLGPRFCHVCLPLWGNAASWSQLVAALQQNIYLTGGDLLHQLSFLDQIVLDVGAVYHRNQLLRNIRDQGYLLQGTTPKQWSIVLEGVATGTHTVLNDQTPLFVVVRYNVERLLLSRQ